MIVLRAMDDLPLVIPRLRPIIPRPTEIYGEERQVARRKSE